MDTGRSDFRSQLSTPRLDQAKSRRLCRGGRLTWHFPSGAAAMVLLALLATAPAFGQTTPFTRSPQPISPVLSGTGGSCATQFAPCPSISRLGLFIWTSGQYLGTGLGGDPHSLTMGGSIDVAMEVASRFAVSASIPGALVRVRGQSSEDLWGIGGPLEARARVRLGPVAPAFYSISPRPLWSSVVEVRTQFLLPDFEGAAKYVGRVQHGVVQPAVYGAGELNLWRFQLAPGVGILVGDREAHADLSLRASVQLLDRLFGDVEVLRRQALAVPKEPGRCQSAWMGSAALRMQFGRGVFVTTRYVGGQGDCVPQHAFMLNLGLAFGEGFMRIPTPDEVGFIKRWHALLMGMVDPILDCQGMMRADDGTPMFRFGTVDSHNPGLVWRNSVSYRVGEHFWEKNGYLYRDTDLSNPVLDLHGESPLTFAERAAMHDCPTLPGLGSPCQVALNLPALRQKVEQGTSPVQVALTEDAQILACLNHLSPLKAAAMFTAIQAALGPLLTKLPQVAQWPQPAAPPAPPPSAPAEIAAVPTHAPPVPPAGQPKVASPPHPTTANRGQRSRPSRQLGRSQKPEESDLPWGGAPPFPGLPGWHSVERSGEVAESVPPASPAGPSGSLPAATTEPSRPSRPAPPPGVAPPPVALNEPPRAGAVKASPAKPRHKDSVATAVPGKPSSQAPEPAAPLCGTSCLLKLGAGLALVVGGGEVAADVLIVGAAVSGESMVVNMAGAASGAVAGKIAVDGVADHVMPPSGPAEPARPASPDKPANSADNTTNGKSTDPADGDKPAATEAAEAKAKQAAEDGRRLKAKTRKEQERAQSLEEKYKNPNFEEDASEKWSRWQSEQVEKEFGKDARRKLHDDKLKGEVNRSRNRISQGREDIR